VNSLSRIPPSLAELPPDGNPLSYWVSTNSCSEPFKLGNIVPDAFTPVLVKHTKHLSLEAAGISAALVKVRVYRARMQRKKLNSLGVEVNAK